MNASDQVQEVWFSGGHGDVGGGLADTSLSDICLRYMINRAKEHEVVFKQSALDQIKPDALVSSPRPRPDQSGVREIIVISGDEKTDKPPKIHHTVFERMAAFGDKYQPQKE